jgi:hypothetical protein
VCVCCTTEQFDTTKVHSPSLSLSPSLSRQRQALLLYNELTQLHTRLFPLSKRAHPHKPADHPNRPTPVPFTSTFKTQKNSRLLLRVCSPASSQNKQIPTSTVISTMAANSRPALLRGQTMPTYLPTQASARHILDGAVASLSFTSGMSSYPTLR